MRSISSVSNIDPKTLSDEDLKSYRSLVRGMQAQLNAVADCFDQEELYRGLKPPQVLPGGYDLVGRCLGASWKVDG